MTSIKLSGKQKEIVEKMRDNKSVSIKNKNYVLDEKVVNANDLQKLIDADLIAHINSGLGLFHLTKAGRTLPI